MSTPKPTPQQERMFALRFERSRQDLFGMLERLYGHRPDYADFVDALTTTLKDNWRRRPEDLKWLDLQRDLEPDWFQRSDQVGYVFYIDRFNGDLQGILEPDKLAHLADLGVTYVHLMPCLKPRDGHNDGGYSVQDYREINPLYGTMDDLEHVASVLRERGISLCIDLVLNHTAKEHEWAVRARAGEQPYTDYYWIYDDDGLPNQYEETLVEIFPDQAPGNFTRYDDFGPDGDQTKWVWTTFNEHQWDLNWANPWVFLEIVDVALFLANKGASVLRLDAVAFMWKRLGTRCQSEPEVHMILHAFRAATRIAAAGVIHLEEAIVSPEEMIPYLGAGEHTAKEGNLAYHNSLMVQFWSALAAQNAQLMTHVLGTHFPPAIPNATYATYLRCHDDIGWAITDSDAAAVGLSGLAHRRFLADYYTGAFAGSPARGSLFQVNPRTGDARSNGSTASLAGLEAALEVQRTERRQYAINRAVDRILLGHALIASYGGIPLLYMGDEIAMLNDYDQLTDPATAGDGRWIQRPFMDWDRVEAARDRAGAGDEESVAARVLTGVTHILRRRKAVPEFHGDYATDVLHPPDERVFAFARPAPAATVVCLFNMSSDHLVIDGRWLREHGVSDFHDLLSDRAVALHDDELRLLPYSRIWLR
ncbi:MAG: alpha-amylase family protein [Acidimicrobiia bacterium]|nr:alpha-amylase family protein [Acidimicrobiia bacterium]MDH5520017.1 alpha-amylase family protein [Acidimicrobiia bacterium]